MSDSYKPHHIVSAVQNGAYLKSNYASAVCHRSNIANIDSMHQSQYPLN